MTLSSEQKKTIGHIAYQIIVILSKSVRDLPFGIVICLIALFFIAPNHVWNDIFQAWKNASLSESAQLIILAKYIIALVWIALLGSHFIIRLSIFSQQP